MSAQGRHKTSGRGTTQDLWLCLRSRIVFSGESFVKPIPIGLWPSCDTSPFFICILTFSFTFTGRQRKTSLSRRDEVSLEAKDPAFPSAPERNFMGPRQRLPQTRPCFSGSEWRQSIRNIDHKAQLLTEKELNNSSSSKTTEQGLLKWTAVKSAGLPSAPEMLN